MWFSDTIKFVLALSLLGHCCACVPFVLQLNVCVCVCVSNQVSAQTDAMIRRVLSQRARLQDGGDYALFLVMTPTSITVGWYHCLCETLLPSQGTLRNLYLLLIRIFISLFTSA